MKHNKGTSLLELIIYIAILSVVATVMVNIFLVTMRSRDTANVRFEVAQNLRFATEQIRQTVFDASAISVSGTCPLNILNVTSTISSATSSFYVSAGVLKFTNASGTSDITTDKIIATTTASCLFTIIDNPLPSPDSLRADIKMVYNSQGRSDLDIGDERQITITLR
mgnify:FL=1